MRRQTGKGNKSAMSLVSGIWARLMQEVKQVSAGLEELKSALDEAPPEERSISIFDRLFGRGPDIREANRSNANAFTNWQGELRGKSQLVRICRAAGGIALGWFAVSWSSVPLGAVAIFWCAFMTVILSRLSGRSPRPALIVPNIDSSKDKRRALAGVGFLAGAATGAHFGAGLGIVAGPLGAIAGTIPGALIGGILGWLGTGEATHQIERLERCQAIVPASSAKVKAGAAGGFFAGAAGGAAVGSAIGIAAGPLGAIVGTIPGALIGGIIGALSGAKLCR